jgi:hypothetical protein
MAPRRCRTWPRWVGHRGIPKLHVDLCGGGCWWSPSLEAGERTVCWRSRSTLRNNSTSTHPLTGWSSRSSRLSSSFHLPVCFDFAAGQSGPLGRVTGLRLHGGTRIGARPGSGPSSALNLGLAARSCEEIGRRSRCQVCWVVATVSSNSPDVKAGIAMAPDLSLCLPRCEAAVSYSE